MSNEQYTYREIRFVIGDELSECYVLIESSFMPAQGWWHKTFPASVSLVEVLTSDEFQPLEWGREAPPS